MQAADATIRCVRYIVKAGDTLGAIARTYRASVSKIAADSNIKNPDLIFPGDVLSICP